MLKEQKHACLVIKQDAYMTQNTV